MAFLLKDSPECTKSELDLFSLPPTQTVIERGQWVEFHPLANVSEGSPVEFNMFLEAEMNNTLIYHRLNYIKVKILKSDGKPLTAESKVGPVNLFLHSMFSQVDISLNERLVSSSNNTYPYRAMIEKLLNHGFDTKTSQLSSEMFFKDTAGRMNVFDLKDSHPNEGFIQRAEMFKLSASVDMIGRLHLDMFHQERLLLNMVDMKIKLIRSKPEFCLLGAGEFKVLLENASLFVRKVRVSPGVVLGHAKALEKSTAKYPINRVLCKAYSIPTGNMSFVQDNIFIGQMPNRIVVACIDNDAFNGNYKKSPFEFKHYNINFIGVYIDGQPVPHNPLQPNFDKNQFIRAYHNLFINAEDKGLYLSRSEFSEGYSLFRFDLSHDLCDGSYLNLVRHSNLRLEIKFGTPLQQTVSLIVYAEFENLIEINKARNILYDFGN
ncbi:uncharacterized protein F54H12.2-like [Stegodyphus dumicola]|uniref:uncharacterized protein F54H12.2-like n=1 Tax=Stegodyphus dumicola TaxID=202533 RepID=UPI0015AECA76|nr:uncharacterized protein F54H12.2-like [Stegodyphus dumicola]